MYSREEILNLLAPKRRDYEIERLLTELENTSHLKKVNLTSTQRVEGALSITNGTIILQQWVSLLLAGRSLCFLE
jgi:predicted DNA-binding ribbon-helix-helix protein